MRANLFWFSDGQWARIEPFIPSNRRGVKPKNNRRILSGIMHVLKSGCRWVDCPPEYGPAKTVYNRFNRWSAQGIWQSIFEAAAEPAEPPERMALDSTHVKAHRIAELLGDKAYDSNSFRKSLRKDGIKPDGECVGTRMTTGNHEGEVGISSQRVSGTAVQRTIAVLGSAVFFVVAPFTLAGLVPWSITGWQLRPPFLGLELTRGIGAIMILAGVPGIVDAFARFALQGLGTPAPIAPPRNLVVTGLYRYVRNPI